MCSAFYRQEPRPQLFTNQTIIGQLPRRREMIDKSLVQNYPANTFCFQEFVSDSWPQDVKPDGTEEPFVSEEDALEARLELMHQALLAESGEPTEQEQREAQLELSRQRACSNSVSTANNQVAVVSSSQPAGIQKQECAVSDPNWDFLLSISPSWHARHATQKRKLLDRVGNDPKSYKEPKVVQLYFTPEEVIQVMRECGKPSWKARGDEVYNKWYDLGHGVPDETHRVPLLCIEDSSSSEAYPKFTFFLA